MESRREAQMAQSSESSLHFFRLFDLAFFAPGATVCGALWFMGVVDRHTLKLDQINGEASQGAALLLIAALASYVIGLVCHGIHRFWRCHIWDASSKVGVASLWSRDLSADACGELAIYF